MAEKINGSEKAFCYKMTCQVYLLVLKCYFGVLDDLKAPNNDLEYLIHTMHSVFGIRYRG